VFAAKTRGDLSALFTDLPSGGHGGASGSAPGDAYAGAQARGGPGGGPAWRGVGRLVVVGVLVPLLLLAGILGVFGIGTGRPFGIVLIFAAFALLRRLLFMIFGRRRARGGGRGRGPRRRR
jgi:hypothetical protein